MLYFEISYQIVPNLLTGNKFTSPHTIPAVTFKYFCILEENLYNKNIVVFDWGFHCYQLSLCCVIFPINLSSLFIIKSDAIYTLLFRLGLSQYVPTDSCLEPVPIIPFLFVAIGFVKPIAATAY